MVRKGFVLGVALVALLVLLWVTGAVVAGPPLEGPEGDVSIAATVGSKISYQGVLKESGSPVTGSRDMTFRLYSDAACTTQVGSDIVESGVQVTDGLFSVDLAVTHSDFDGQGLWLEVEVGGTKIGCQEILPVPYALSLRPGARVEGDSADPVTTVINHGLGTAIKAQGAAVGLEAVGMTGVEGEGDVGVRGTGILGSGVVGTVAGETNTSPGVLGENPNYSGVGVEGHAGFGTGVKGQGEIGVSGQSSVGPGVEGRGGPVGVSGHSDIAVGVHGVGSSNPAIFPGGYGGYFVGDSGIYAEEEDDAGADYAGYFVGDVRITDSLVVEGPATGFFPRPAWDSGWVALTPGACPTPNHNLGGDVDNYVVDMQFKDTDGIYGINIHGHGAWNRFGDYVGGYWHSLTNTSISICRKVDDTYADRIRIRIWVYK